MKKTKSAKPRKQRLYKINAPMHIKRKFLILHIAKQLRQKIGIKQKRIGARSGMKVKVIKGKYKKREGLISRISISECRLYIEGISQRNARGREKLIGISPSNVEVIDEKIKEYIDGGISIKRYEQQKKQPSDDTKDTDKKTELNVTPVDAKTDQVENQPLAINENKK